MTAMQSLRPAKSVPTLGTYRYLVAVFTLPALMLNSLLALVGGGLQCRVDFYNGIACEDCGEVWVVPWDSYQEQIKAFDASGTIQGAITIRNSGGSDTWIQNIKLVFSQYVHYLDPYINNDMLTVEVDVSSSVLDLPCWLSSTLPSSTSRSQDQTLEIPFNFTLHDHVQESDRHLIFESYNGTNIGIRHKLDVVVEKQWYQFQTVVSSPIYIYKHQEVVSATLSTCMEIPVRDEEIEPPTAIPATVTNEAEAKRNNGEDMGELSKIVLPTQTLDLFGPLEGYVQITNIDVPIENIELRLLRRELIGGFCFEEILQIHTLIGEENVREGERLNSKITHTRGHIDRKDEGIEEQDEKWDADFSPIRIKSMIRFSIPFSTSDCHLMTKTRELTAPSSSRPMSRTTGGTSMNDDRQFTNVKANESSGFGDIILSPSFDVASEMGKRPLTHNYGGVFSVPKRGQTYGEDVPSALVILPLQNTEIPREATMRERSDFLEGRYNDIVSSSSVSKSSTKFHDLTFNDTVAVRYYIRCKVIDTLGKRYWNTKEIQMARLSEVVASDYAPPMEEIEMGRDERDRQTRYASAIV